MTREDRRYVRIYYQDLIRDYPDMWDDDAALACYVRLLSTADPMWPTPPDIPRAVKRRALDKLLSLGLVIALPLHRFGIKGLDAERTARSNAGRIAAASRWALPVRERVREREKLNGELGQEVGAPTPLGKPSKGAA